MFSLIRPLAAVAAAVAALGLAACGSDDEGAVKERVNGVYDAFAAKDGKKVCSSLNEEAKKSLTQGASQGKKQSCEDVMKFVFGIAGKELQGIGDAKVSKVDLKGDKGTVTIKYKGKSEKIGVAKSDGEWLISDLDMQ